MKQNEPHQSACSWKSRKACNTSGEENHIPGRKPSKQSPAPLPLEDNLFEFITGPNWSRASLASSGHTLKNRSEICWLCFRQLRTMPNDRLPPFPCEILGIYCLWLSGLVPEGKIKIWFCSETLIWTNTMLSARNAKMSKVGTWSGEQRLGQWFNKTSNSGGSTVPVNGNYRDK